MLDTEQKINFSRSTRSRLDMKEDQHGEELIDKPSKETVCGNQNRRIEGQTGRDRNDISKKLKENVLDTLNITFVKNTRKRCIQDRSLRIHWRYSGHGRSWCLYGKSAARKIIDSRMIGRRVNWVGGSGQKISNEEKKQGVGIGPHQLG